jgi:hypothetical protein
MTKHTLQVISFTNKHIYQRKAKGYLVNERFVIARPTDVTLNTFLIYSLATGKPLLDIQFTDEYIALSLIRWLDSIYSDYFFILDDPEWAGHNIFAITRYTIPNGLLYHELLSLMEGHTINTEANLQFYAGQAKTMLAERIFK